MLNASVNSFGNALLVLRFIRDVTSLRNDRYEFSGTLRNVKNFFAITCKELQALVPQASAKILYV